MQIDVIARNLPVNFLGARRNRRPRFASTCRSQREQTRQDRWHNAGPAAGSDGSRASCGPSTAPAERAKRPAPALLPRTAATAFRGPLPHPPQQEQPSATSRMPPSGRSRIPAATATAAAQSRLTSGFVPRLRPERGDGAVERNRSKEDAQRLRQRSDGVVGGKRAQRGQQKCEPRRARRQVLRARSAMRKQPATSMTICTSRTALIMLASEQRKAGGQKRRIAGQANPGRPRAFGVGQAEDAVVEPVLGDVAVNQRIAGDVRESNVEEKPQGQSGQGDQQEVLPRLPEHAPERRALRPPQRVALLFQHVANIAARPAIGAREIRWKGMAFTSCGKTRQ